jgi:hypothetical protein
MERSSNDGQWLLFTKDDGKNFIYPIENQELWVTHSKWGKEADKIVSKTHWNVIYVQFGTTKTEKNNTILSSSILLEELIQLKSFNQESINIFTDLYSKVNISSKWSTLDSEIINNRGLTSTQKSIYFYVLHLDTVSDPNYYSYSWLLAAILLKHSGYTLNPDICEQAQIWLTHFEQWHQDNDQLARTLCPHAISNTHSLNDILNRIRQWAWITNPKRESII